MPASANPTGGAVAAGSASISTSPGTVTINQVSNQTVINWQSFSIGAGETTKFLQPSSQSAALNRVLGGQTSIIDGTLSANGQIYLLNGNGILVGPGGVVNANGFTASTRDLSDADFLKGNLHFTGSGDGGVSNLGQVNALGGDVIFIGKTVNNAGTISAPNGHVGMAAADDVTVTQQGMEHVYVRATGNATEASGKIGVNNTGTIAAASAELKAANGNIYALAVNNGGTIRATGVSHSDGHIYLVAEGNLGTTQNTGTLTARRKGGKGGAIETSGGLVVTHGTIDAGSGGSWLIDPSTINIDAPTAATIDASLNAGTAVTEDSSAGTGGTGNITVASALTWTGTGALTLEAYNNLIINAGITGTNGTLNVRSAYNGGAGSITTGAGGTINVLNFNLQGGAWNQNLAILPAFAATNFAITAGSFLRSNGGGGTAANPYQLVDVYGLQGIGSSAALEADSYRVNAAFSAGNTATWNGGAGFNPIANFSGTFNGNGAAISGLTINRPTTDNVGLFANVAAAGTVTGAILTGAAISGQNNVGAIAGTNAGAINATSAAGTVTGATGKTGAGGLAGTNSGQITNSFANVATKGYNSVGGLAGVSTGTILSSYALGGVTSYGTMPTAGTDFGGLVGYNNGGSIVLSYAEGAVTASDSNNVGGFIGENKGTVQQGYTKGTTVAGYQNVGGLIGVNDGGVTVTGVQVLDGPGTVSVTGTVYVGGLVGSNLGTLTNGSVVSTGTVTAKDGALAAQYIGGFAGSNAGTLSGSFSQINVAEATGTTDATRVGGFAGYNTAAGTINSAYASGTVHGATQVGGLVGESDGALGIQVNATGAVTGITQVGGLIGYNTGSLGIQSYATGNVAGTTDVGGLIGQNTAAGKTFSSIYAKGTVTGTSYVGGLVGNNTGGAFTTVYSSSTVTGTGAAEINLGGLMGYNNDVITLSYATGAVTAATAGNVGGLVGNNGAAGKIKSGVVGSSSYASGNVTGATAVGGLVGHNDGAIGDTTATMVEALGDYTHATGTVTGQNHTGGLVGENAGSVQQASASGAVKGASTSATATGGLAGINQAGGTITTSFSTSTVYGNGTATLAAADTDAQTGGLAGANLGSISMSNATGAVVGDNQAGGLVGINNLNAAVVTTSYSTGAVMGVVDAGGLVGQNALGSVNQSYSESVVTGGTGSIHVGGLVGDNKATIYETYATGATTGANLVGGLVGFNETGATLTESYSTGLTTSAGTSGGLVGDNAGTVTFSYWDENSTGQGTKGIGAGINLGASGLFSNGSAPSAFDTLSYLGFGVAAPVATGSSNAESITDTSNHLAWYQFNGSTRPFLAWEAPINNPISGGSHLVYTAHQLQLMAINLGSSFVLGQSIDLSETGQASGLWNTATGFSPIGDGTKAFTGSFGGAGYGVSGLTINEATTSDIGLFGANAGSIGGVTVSGNVTGLNDVGVLVGLNEAGGTVNNVTVNGTATGTSHVGGLAGENDNTIQTAAVNVAVHGNNNVGGVVGDNTGTASDAYSIGNVTGTGTNPTDLGGYAGYNGGTITVSYATGTVAGGAGSSNVGGFVGDNEKTITQSYATGATSGITNVGGLAGTVGNGATASETYATGTATGTTNVGGLIGALNMGGAVHSSYAKGAVSGPGATTGGLIGAAQAGATYTDLYWDHVLAGTAKSIGSNLVAGGGAITDLNGTVIGTGNDQTTYKGFDYVPQVGFSPGYEGSARVFSSSDTNWRIQIGTEFPLLTKLSTQVSGTSYTDAAHTMLAVGTTDTLNSGSNLLATTTTDANAAYDFLFAADDGLFNYIPKVGQTLRVSNAANSADSIAAATFNPMGVPSLLADVAPADTWGQTVRVVSNNLTNTLLAGAGSAFISIPTANGNGGTNLLISENFEVAPGLTSYAPNGDITADGNVAFDSAGVVPSNYNAGVTLQAAGTVGNPTPSFTLNAGLSSNAYGRAIIVESDGTFVNNDGMNAINTPNGNYIVYSQNPEGAIAQGTTYQDTDGGINQYHLYGTDYMSTPAYLLDPTQNYQVYTFTPTLTLTAVATGADMTTGTLSVQYGTSTPPLLYYSSGLLTGDTDTAGQTMNQVLSNQPAEMTTYAKYSNVGDYPVSFIGSTLPTSLIGYKLVFKSGDINVTPSTTPVTIDVSGQQNFAYIGGGATYAKTVMGGVAGDPNFNPQFSTLVGKFTDIGTYSNTISVTPASVSNYQNVTINLVDGGYVVHPAPITVAATGTSIYGNTPANPTVTSTGTIYSGVAYGVSGGGTVATIASTGYSATNPVTAASDVNTYTIPVSFAAGVNAADLANYTVTANNGTYTVTQRPVTIDATRNETTIYDGTPQQTTFGATDYTVNTGTDTSGVGLINGDTIVGVMGRANNTSGNVGTYLYTQNTLAVQNSDASPISNYAVTYSNQGFGYIINPEPITIKALISNTKTYGNADPAYTIGNGYYSLETGTLAAGETFNSTGQIARVAGENVNPVGSPYLFNSVGTVGVQKGATNTTSNYTITLDNSGMFGQNIIQRNVTLSPLGNATKVYGSTDPTFNGYSVTAGSLAPTDEFTGVFGRATGENVNGGTPYAFSVGSVHPVNATTSVNETSNYNFTFTNPTPYGLVITPAPLTVTAQNDTETYRGTPYTGDANGVTYSPFQFTDTPASLTGPLTYSGASQTTANAGGPYTITPGGLSSPNYMITFVNGNLTINKAPLTITPNNDTEFYNGMTHPGDASGLQYAGLVNNEPTTVLGGAPMYSGASQTAVNAGGPYAINVTGFTSNNYAISYGTGQLTISPEPLTIKTVISNTKTYGDADPAYTFGNGYYALESGTLATGETFNPTGQIARVAGENVNPVGSPYLFNSAGTVGVEKGATNTSSNYTLTLDNSGMFGQNIIQRNVTLSPLGNATKVYGSADPTFDGYNVTAGSLAPTDEFTGVFGRATGENVNGGTPYAFTVGGVHPINATTSANETSNYNFTFSNPTPYGLVITPAPLTVTAQDDTETYKGTPYLGDANGVTYSPFQFTDTPASLTGPLTYSGASQTTANAGGPYTITPGGLSSPNYMITFVNGNLTINKASLTITPKNDIETYNGMTHPGDASGLQYTGLVNNEPATVLGGGPIYSGASQTAVNAGGPYAIGVTGFTSNNYAISYGSGALTISQAPLTITADNQTKVFGQTFMFNGTEFTENGLLPTDSLTSVGLTSAGTPASANIGSYSINITPGSEVGMGLSNYAIALVPGHLTVFGIVGQPSVPGTLRYEYDQFSHIIYDLNVYGDRHYYELEVPGTITRYLPKNLKGIGSGSSLIQTTIGMETVYNVDRFQTYRH